MVIRSERDRAHIRIEALEVSLKDCQSNLERATRAAEQLNDAKTQLANSHEEQVVCLL